MFRGCHEQGPIKTEIGAILLDHLRCPILSVERRGPSLASLNAFFFPLTRSAGDDFDVSLAECISNCELVELQRWGGKQDEFCLR